MAKRSRVMTKTINLVTVRQAASVLGVSLKSVYRWLELGAIGPIYEDEHGRIAIDHIAVCKLLNRFEIDFPARAKLGRPLFGDRPLTNAERKRRHRQHHREKDRS